jgi:hypothetical protein
VWREQRLLRPLPDVALAESSYRERASKARGHAWKLGSRHSAFPLIRCGARGRETVDRFGKSGPVVAAYPHLLLSNSRTTNEQ